MKKFVTFLFIFPLFFFFFDVSITKADISVTSGTSPIVSLSITSIDNGGVNTRFRIYEPGVSSYSGFCYESNADIGYFTLNAGNAPGCDLSITGTWRFRVETTFNTTYSNEGDYDNITEIQGCTDSSAYNYNPEADINDGSCLYYIINYVLAQYISFFIISVFGLFLAVMLSLLFMRKLLF